MCICISRYYRGSYYTIIAAASDVYIQEKMPPMLLLPSCNYAEVDYENATHAADTHINTSLLPTAISLLLYRYY